jgi:LPXTG-motif cell wall-anchored protein
MARPWFRPALRAALVIIGVALMGLVAAAPALAGPTPCTSPVPYRGCEGIGVNGVRAVTDTVLTVPPTPAPNGYGSTRSDLPTTGLDVGGLLVLGVTMVVAGILLVTVRRRGARSTLAALPPDEDHVWHAPTMELPVWHRTG